jgi:AcrR family transcriptional regulator
MPRRYSSPLRESQATRTHDLILDAMVELLADHRVDEVSTKQIAERAGVSQPTVYRHFPDRIALVDGLAERVDYRAAGQDGANNPRTADDWADWAIVAFKLADDHAAEVVPDAVLNADPRRLSRASRRRSDEMLAAVARSFPQLDERDHRRVAALMRTLVSTQSWLRIREEFSIDGAESGPLVSWALRTLLCEVRDGHLPLASSPQQPGAESSRSAQGQSGSTGTKD